MRPRTDFSPRGAPSRYFRRLGLGLDPPVSGPRSLEQISCWTMLDSLEDPDALEAWKLPRKPLGTITIALLVAVAAAAALGWRESRTFFDRIARESVRLTK